MSGLANGRNGFPELPILDSIPPPRTERDKYGGLYFLGIGGLALLVLMIAWFVYSAWRLRDVWALVYTLHDPKRSEAERIESASRLSLDRRFNDRQLMETCLRRDLPDRARYMLAEAVSTEAVARDPRAYALTVALSQDWPNWLRLCILARRLAYGATRGYAIPEVALDELSKHPDPVKIRFCADYSLAVLPEALSTDAAAKLARSGARGRRQRKTRRDASGGERRTGRRARTPSRRGHALAEASSSRGGENLGAACRRYAEGSRRKAVGGPSHRSRIGARRAS